MATKISKKIAVPIVDPIATQINQSIDRLILSLEQRRVQLLSDLRERQEEMRAKQVSRQQAEQEMTKTKEFLERQMKHNKLLTLQGRMIGNLETEMAKMNVTQPPREVTFHCDTRDLEGHISRLGEIVQLDIPPISSIPAIPDKRLIHTIPKSVPTTSQIPAVPLMSNYAFFSFINEKSAPGELNNPRGVSIDKKHIYVADMYNSRIQIFTHTGKYLKQFGQQHLYKPHGILVHQDSIYVTDRAHHAIFLFRLSDLTLVKRVGKKGSGNREFNNPGQLAISHKQHLYVPDQNNNRIQIFSTNLAFQGSLRHPTMTTPVDIKFTNTEMLVLSYSDNPCIHVFTLSGEKSRSLVTRGYGMQVKGAFFFCLYEHNKIIISDELADNLKVFSMEGRLLHTIGEYKLEARRFCSPAGLTVNNNKLVCVCDDSEYSLQIFSV